MYQQYDKAVQNVLKHLVEQGFSKTPRKVFRQATRVFRRYLVERSLQYSHSLAQSWVNKLKPSLPRWKFLSFRQSLTLVENVVRNGSVTNTWFSYDDAPLKYRVPEIIKEYHKQAEHRTPDGKNAYIRRIKGFVRFLAMKKLVPEMLEFAFATEKASRVSIVTTLSKEQVDGIRTFSENSSSLSQLRSAAMTILALRMGLRSVDICNLCLSDISWESRIISIIQQKTGTPLMLPFPVEVGNILARYILEGRPKCDDPNVFITLKHPYTKL